MEGAEQRDESRWQSEDCRAALCAHTNSDGRATAVTVSYGNAADLNERRKHRGC